MGRKAEVVESMLDDLVQRSDIDSSEGVIQEMERGLSKLTLDEMLALRRVLDTTFDGLEARIKQNEKRANDIEERIEVVKKHYTPEQVPRDLSPMVIEMLDRSSQGGVVESQIDSIGGIAVNMVEFWQTGDLAGSKQAIACIRKILSNVERVIKAQLYDNLH